MKHVLVLVALASLATTGCAGNRMLGRANCCDDVCCSVGCGPQGPRSTFLAARQGARSRVCTEVCDGCVDCYSDCHDGSCSIGNGHGAYHGHPCGGCGGRGCGLCGGFVGRIASGFCPHATGYPEMHNFNQGPPTGQVAYPYYTVRGPRDFLQANPPSIGPY